MPDGFGLGRPNGKNMGTKQKKLIFKNLQNLLGGNTTLKADFTGNTGGGDNDFESSKKGNDLPIFCKKDSTLRTN